MNPTPEQKSAIEIQDRALLVEAGAGTGKTWVLVQRFLHMLTTNPHWTLDNIVAITFTEKAAREMRTRLRKEIEAKRRSIPDDPAWLTRWRNIDRLQVGTIHSLCARILRENAIAVGLDPFFQVLDEQQSSFIKDQAIEETLRTLQAEDHPALTLLASLRVIDLRSEMAQILDKRGALYPVWDELADGETLLKKWQAGLDQMRWSIWSDRLQNYPDLVFALEQLPHLTIPDPDDKLSASVLSAQQGCRALAEDDLVTAANCWQQIKLNVGSQTNWGGKDALKDLKAQLRAFRDAAENLEKAKALENIGSMDEMAAQHLLLWRVLWERLEQTYRQLKNAQQALDFDDLEILTEGLLQSSPRPERLQIFLDNLSHLMVDEFQDTNLTQQRIIYALAPVEQPGKLFLVGDAKQSIYRFRQAQVSGFSQTASRLRLVTGAAPVRLSTSFRTHQNLVQATNYLFDYVFKPFAGVHADYEAQPGGLLARRASIPELRNCLEFLLLRQKDLDGENISSQEARIWEAQWIARRLFQLKESAAPVWDKALQCYRPFEFRDAAVLFRATTQLPLYESEFKKAGLPYLTISGRGFYNRQEVQDLIAMLSALANPLDDLSLAACLRSPLFSLSDETLYRLRWRTSENHLSQEPIPLKNALSNPPFSEQRDLVSRANKVLETLWSFVDWVDVWQLLRTALDLTGFEIVLIQNDGENGRQRANVHKFLSLARGQGGASISAFLSRLRDLQALEAREGEALGSEPESGAVQLMSIHAAKGLEFPVLVVADLGRGKRHDTRSSYLLHDPAFGFLCKVRDEWGEWQEPASYAWGKWLDQKMEEAERKRLLYVACTRAADLLLLTGQVGSGDSWLQQILNAYEIDPDGPEDELCQHDSFGMRIFRPVQPEDILPVERLENSSHQCLDTPPNLACPLPLQMASVSTAVTQLERPRRLGDTKNFKIHPAVWIDSNLSETGRAPRRLIGEIVHRALANWNCLSFSNYELTQYLEKLAHRYAIDSQVLAHAVSSSFNMLDRLKRHQLYATLQSAAEQYRELPFTLATHQGTLHGVIDLLYQDAQGGWHVLDWKTEWTPEKEMTDHAQEHLLQMAIYALAVEKQLGIMPEVSLCFLSPRVLEYKVEHDMIKEVLSRFSEQIRK